MDTDRLALLEYQAIWESQGMATFSCDAASPSGTFSCDAACGIFVRVSDAFCSWLGVEPRDLVGKHHSVCFDEAFARGKELTLLWEKLRVGEKQSVELRYLHRNGNDVWIRASFVPVRAEGEAGLRVLMCAVEELKQKTATQFLANMSHEIRTPMNGIFGMLSLLQDVALGERAKGYVDVCLHSAESLLAVLDDVLLFAKSEDHSITLERAPFNLNNAIEDVLFIAAGNVSPFQDIDITCFIEPDVPLCLVGDASRLRQVLQHLFTNAVKFTKLGEVGLRVSVASQSPLTLMFEVTDTGLGISEDDQKRLFIPFRQADSSNTRPFGGAGLGLAICKRLVTLFEGEIGVKSQAGKGSAFWFTAKFHVTAFNAMNVLGLTDLHANILKDLSILIVDDNATNCMALETTLRLCNCRCQVARSGKEAVERVRVASEKGRGFDVVLLDYHMPGMNGLEVARQIGNMFVSGDAPKIVALSSSMDHGMFRHEPCIVAYTSKPFRRSQLLHIICDVMSGKMMMKTGAPSGRKLNGGNLSGATVLLVEDNETNRVVAREILKRARCNIVEAYNGADCLEKVNDKVDVVIMDVHMPVLDGIAATRYIRQSYADLPIVILTADHTEDTRTKSMAAGATRLLLKPVKKDDLLQELCDVLGQHGDAWDQGSYKPDRVRFLIVDDVETNRALAAHQVRKVLERVSRVEIVFASTGEDAIKTVQSSTSSFDWCLMDVKMQGMGGIAAAHILRQLPQGRSMRIVGLTGYDDPKTLQECHEAGMSQVLIKPLREHHLAFLFHPSDSDGDAKSPPPADEAPVLFDESFIGDLEPPSKMIVVREWKGSSLSLIVRLRAHLAASDAKEMQDAAHLLKGSCGQIGACWASAIASEIEQKSVALELNRVALAKLIDQLEEVLLKTIARLSS
jgi:PAS domain S-box-containing protein